MRLAALAERLLAKADQPGLWPDAPLRRGLRRELHVNRRGHQQHRWVRPGEAPRAARRVQYFAATSSSLEGKHADLGVMVNAHTTGIHRGVQEGRAWGMDNGAYSGRFEPHVLMDALERFAPYRGTCRFVVAPDVLGDGAATEALYRTWRPIIRRAGYPVAFVAHAGTTRLPDCDALFVPALNLEDPHIPRLVEEARRAGKWVHVGRVNSETRTSSMFRLGADSVDGTHTRFKGVERAVGDMGAWMDAANAQAQVSPLLTEDRRPEPPARYAARVSRSAVGDAARLRDAVPLPELPPGELHTGMLVGHAGRVGVLHSEPEDGWAMVAFDDPWHEDGGGLEDLPAHQVYGPVTLAAPHHAQTLTPRQMAGNPESRKKKRRKTP